jgi:hypothetical protein
MKSFDVDAFAETFRATTRGVSQSWDAFHAEERRQGHARAAFRGGRIRDHVRGRSLPEARAPARFQSVRTPRARRARTACGSRDGPGLSDDDGEPPKQLDPFDAFALALGWERVAS